MTTISSAGAAPAAASDPSMSMGTDPTAGTGGDGSGDDSGQVLLTVMKTGPGTYELIVGDEDDDSGSGDMGASGGSSDMGAGASQGQTFDSKGELLKAILDVLNEDASSEGASGSAEDQFQAGYSGAGS